MRTKLYRSILASIVILAFVFSFIPSANSSISRPIVKVVEKIGKKFGDEAAEKATRLISKFPDDLAPFLIKIIDSVPAHKADVILRVLDIIPNSQIKRFAELCKQYPDFIDVVGSTNALKYLSKYSHYAEPFYKVLKEFPGNITIDIFKAVDRLPPISAKVIILELSRLAKQSGGALSMEHMIAFRRILYGKTYSSKHVDEIFKALRSSLGNKAPTSIGDLAEEMVMSAINGNRLPNRHLLDLRPGSKVIKGQHDAVHGIDLIGVGKNGNPVILEITAGKNLSAKAGPVQMSPKWVAENWAKFTKDPNNVAKLKKMGIDEKYLPPNQVSESMVKNSFNRKFIAPQSASIAGIQKAGMSGVDDIVRM